MMVKLQHNFSCSASKYNIFNVIFLIETQRADRHIHSKNYSQMELQRANSRHVPASVISEKRFAFLSLPFEILVSARTHQIHQMAPC